MSRVQADDLRSAARGLRGPGPCVGVDGSGSPAPCLPDRHRRPGDPRPPRGPSPSSLRDYQTIEALDTALAEERRQADENPARITVGELVDRWLEHATPELGITTVDGYRKYERLYIAPRLGDVPLAQLTPKKIDDFYSALRQPGGAHRRKNGLSATTVHHCHAVLRRALAQAVKWDWIATNPADRASPPKLARSRSSSRRSPRSSTSSTPPSRPSSSSSGSRP